LRRDARVRRFVLPERMIASAALNRGLGASGFFDSLPLQIQRLVIKIVDTFGHDHAGTVGVLGDCVHSNFSVGVRSSPRVESSSRLSLLLAEIERFARAT
jgi:hypothetical protein